MTKDNETTETILQNTLESTLPNINDILHCTTNFVKI